MRNLKRALSLTLASVMLLGMMVVGSSALSFNDADDISNVTAATVLEELGVMQGDGQGNFMPEQSVTRAQMAILICRILYGDKLNVKQFEGVTQYTDVPTTEYYTGYINLATQLGIIGGYGDGRFGPDDTVTTAQAALMLSRALGYFKANELATGDWALAAVAQATKIEMFGDLKLGTNDLLARDNVAEMVFNTMTKAVPVQYSERWDVYYNDSQAITQGVKFDYRDTLAYQNFDLVYNEGKVDDFDRPATEWGIGVVKTDGLDDKGHIDKNGATIKTSFVKDVDEADLTYTAKVKLGDIYKDLGLSETVAARNVTFYVDGKEETAPSITKGDSTKIAQSGNGVLTQVFYTPGSRTDTVNKVIITCINTYVGTVASVTAASGSADRYVNVAVKSPRANLNTKFETENFAAKDLISYTCAYNDGTAKYDIVAAKVLEKTATDILTKWTGIDVGNSDNSFTAGGTYKYDVNAYIDVDGAPGSITGFTVDESELEIYCDDYGYAIYVSGVEGTKNYAVVIGVGNTNPYGDQTTGATLLLADGTQKTVTAKWKSADNGSVALSKGDSTSAPVKTSGENLVNDMLGDVVTYKVNKDGVYELTMGGLNAAKDDATGAWDATNYAADGDVTFVNGRSLLTLNCTSGTNSGDATYDKTIYTTEKTVFFVATKNSKNEVVYNVYTGYREMPSLKTGAGTAIKGIGYVMNSDYTTQADAVFIAVDSVKGLSANRTFVVKQKDHEVITDSLGSYFKMPAIDADGNVVTVTVDAKNLGDDSQGLDNKGSTQVTSVVSMSDVTKNSDDIITGATFDTPYSSADFQNGQSYYKTTGVVAPLNGVIGLGDDDKNNAVYWAYTKDTKFYEVNEDMDAIAQVSASDILTDDNDVVFFVADDDATASYKVVKTVIVQKVAAGAGPAPITPAGIASYSVGYLGNSDGSKNVQILIGGHLEDGTFDHWLSKAEIEALNITADNIYIENKGAEVKTKFGLGQEGTVYPVATSADTDSSGYKYQFDKSPLAVFEITQYDGKKATGSNVGTDSATTAIDRIGYNCGFLKIHVEKALELASGQADETLKVWLQIDGETYTSADAYKNS